MYKVFSLIGVFFATLMVYVIIESVLESALRRRKTTAARDSPTGPTQDVADAPKLTSLQKRILFGGVLTIAAIVVAVFWKSL